MISLYGLAIFRVKILTIQFYVSVAPLIYKKVTIVYNWQMVTTDDILGLKVICSEGIAI